jgi:hypothetical protein
MSSEETPETPARSNRARTLHRIALAQAVLLLVVVIIALPVAFRSMGTQLTERQSGTLYDFPSGEAITGVATQDVIDSESFFNIAAIDLDEDSSSITLAISGHRNCDGPCAPLKMTLFSLDDDADVRRALPPSAPLTFDPSEQFFSQTVQLPIRGQPSQYPFDDYLLWLGLVGRVTNDGQEVPITPENIAGNAVFTTQNQLRDFTMTPPTEIDPARVQSITDPFSFFGVQELRFERPVHQEILAILLIALIAVSAIMAVFMREVSDLIVGIGSLVLGIWGVRSVLVPQPIPVVTSIDLALSVVILFVLLGLSVRAAMLFRKTSELPEIKMPRRRR